WAGGLGPFGYAEA
ncbi:hypothetical protein N7465_003582, partial [Penicillium sp. CMV-2018d]